LEKVKNVVLEYDKDLLKNALNTKEVSIQPKELERLWEGLGIYSNPEMYQICLISYMTSARRSEILTMKKNQVREFPVPHLIFPITKTKSRTVYIDKSTYEYIKSILPSDRDNLFTYSISGFGKVFYDEIRRLQIKLNDGRLINFHSFRKLAITNKLIELGKSNTIIASQYLGFASVKKLQAHADGIIEMPTTQHDLLKNIGHSSPQTTLQHYFSPQLKGQNSSRIDELKKKKSQGNITHDEQNELLDLLLEATQ
jgi:integrase